MGALYFQEQKSSDHLYHNSLQACLRGNTLRQETNNRLESIATQRIVLRDFLKTAYVARLNSASSTGSLIDKQAAQEYKEYLRKLNSLQRLKRIPLVNCDTTIKKP